jgi:ferric-dicitrate binding protein FerR (iron transport regulator)
MSSAPDQIRSEGHTPNAQDSTRVSTGEQARVAGGRTIVKRKANIADAVGWREHRLVFEDAPLSDVVAEPLRTTPGFAPGRWATPDRVKRC